MANSVDPDQTATIGSVCSGSTQFASILNSSVIICNYLQQTTSADDIFRCIFCGALSFNQCNKFMWKSEKDTAYKKVSTLKTTKKSTKTFSIEIFCLCLKTQISLNISCELSAGSADDLQEISALFSTNMTKKHNTNCVFHCSQICAL